MAARPWKPSDTIRDVVRVAKIILALAVIAAGIRLVVSKAPEPIQGPNPSPPASVADLANALRENAGSPYRWLELAEGYEQQGDREKARFCFHRAEELGPRLPPVWIRAAGFYFRLGEREEGLRAGVRAQAISDGGDAFLFQYYDRFVQDAPLVVTTLAGDKRALAAYLRHLMTTGQADDAGVAWEELKRRDYAGQDLAIAYVEFLLGQRRYQTAGSVWGKEAPAEGKGGYPEANAVYNGGFERDPSGCRLDWRFSPTEAAQVERDSSVAKEGQASLRVRFGGTQNIAFGNVAETVVVEPGNYRFTAWLKTDEISTDEGVRFCFSDAEASARFSKQTDSTRGTHDWFKVQQDFTAPPLTRLIDVAVCRTPSIKFDNKINGTVWIDGVSLTRLR